MASPPVDMTFARSHKHLRPSQWTHGDTHANLYEIHTWTAEVVVSAFGNDGRFLFFFSHSQSFTSFAPDTFRGRDVSSSYIVLTVVRRRRRCRLANLTPPGRPHPLPALLCLPLSRFLLPPSPGHDDRALGNTQTSFRACSCPLTPIRTFRIRTNRDRVGTSCPNQERHFLISRGLL